MEEEGIEIMAENIQGIPSFGRYLLRQKTQTQYTVEMWI
jgi:hypothetical protein